MMNRQAIKIHRIKTPLKYLLLTFIALGFSSAWAQNDDVEIREAILVAAADDMMPGMDHSKMKMGDKAKETTQQTPDMGGMDHGDMQMQGGSAPDDARDPHENSGGFSLESGPYVLPGPRQLRMADEQTLAALMVNRLERVNSENANSTVYDAQAWIGRDYNKLVLKAEGDIVAGKLEEASTGLFWSHAIASYWDTQLGLRYDSGDAPDRRWLAFGVQGIAPYWFEIDAMAYIGEGGRTALNLGAEYELLLTQKLVLQPRIDTNFYGESDTTRGQGSGLSDLSAGLRLRYEILREFAPYVGVEWARKLGQTADFSRLAGEDTSETRWVAGLRFWF